MPYFELTDEQAEIAGPYILKAKESMRGDVSGAVFGQIGRYGDGSIRCRFEYLPEEPATKIKKILDDHIKQVRGE